MLSDRALSTSSGSLEFTLFSGAITKLYLHASLSTAATRRRLMQLRQLSKSYHNIARVE